MQDIPDSDPFREARSAAAAIARAAVAGEISTAEAREEWPLEEDVDASVDALAHIYFDHFAWTAKRRVPDEYDIASVMELAELMADGDPLDEERLRGFESVWEITFGGQHVFMAVVVLALLAYVLVRVLT